MNFKEKILEIDGKIRSACDPVKNPIANAFYPVVNLALTMTQQQMQEDESKVYLLLKKIKSEVDEALEIYENQPKP